MKVEAVFYDLAPIPVGSRIKIVKSNLMAKGTRLLILEMVCVDSGIRWQGSPNNPVLYQGRTEETTPGGENVFTVLSTDVDCNMRWTKFKLSSAA